MTGENASGNLEKMSFRPTLPLRIQLFSMEYLVYACGNNFLRASILNGILNFSSSPSGYCILLQTM
jgi:hypothetical protein